MRLTVLFQDGEHRMPAQALDPMCLAEDAQLTVTAWRAPGEESYLSRLRAYIVAGALRCKGYTRIVEQDAGFEDGYGASVVISSAA